MARSQGAWAMVALSARKRSVAGRSIQWLAVNDAAAGTRHFLFMAGFNGYLMNADRGNGFRSFSLIALPVTGVYLLRWWALLTFSSEFCSAHVCTGTALGAAEPEGE